MMSQPKSTRMFIACGLFLLTSSVSAFQFTHLVLTDLENDVICTGCKETAECQLENSGCKDGLCKCFNGYTLINGRCETDIQDPGSLGGFCNLLEDCSTDYALCSHGVCTCHATYVPHFDECLKEKNHGDECKTSEQCPENAYCNCGGECSCKTGFVYEGNVINRCLPKRSISETCEATVQCQNLYGECVEKKCGCKDGYGLDHSKKMCLPIIQTFEVSMLLELLDYAESLNQESYETNKELKDKIDSLSNSVKDTMEEVGHNVKDVSVARFMKNPKRKGMYVIFIVDTYNPDVDGLDVTTDKVAARRKRAHSSNYMLKATEIKLMKRTKHKTKIERRALPEATLERSAGDMGTSCDSEEDCKYHNSECIQNTCGCMEDHGPSRTTKHCVAILYSLETAFEMANLTYDQKLNDHNSKEYKAISGEVKQIIQSIKDSMVQGGINVKSAKLSRFEPNPAEPGTKVILIVEAYNPDADRSSMKKREAYNPGADRPSMKKREATAPRKREGIMGKFVKKMYAKK